MWFESVPGSEFSFLRFWANPADHDRCSEQPQLRACQTVGGKVNATGELESWTHGVSPLAQPHANARFLLDSGLAESLPTRAGLSPPWSGEVTSKMIAPCHISRLYSYGGDTHALDVR